MTIRPQHVKKEAATAPNQAGTQAGASGPDGAACVEGNSSVETVNNIGGMASRSEGPLSRDSGHQQMTGAAAGQKRRHRTSPHRHRKRVSLASPSAGLSSSGCQPGPSHATSPCSSMSCSRPPLGGRTGLDNLSSLSPLATRPDNGQADGDNEFSAYNSGDEYDRPDDANALSEREMSEREIRFELLLRSKGLTIKKMEEDGACLFRAVADQIYGDQDMHGVVRKLCMDYLTKNADYFSHYLTEPFDQYVERKRRANAHGNHIEMHALSEMYNRPIEIYHYSEEPINIFHGSQKSDLDPIRLSYHRGVHYNSIVDPFKATIGVGLGLPGFEPGIADKEMLVDAIRASEHTELERQMLKDKLLATDWEATTEALERQVAQESYLEYLRENERRTRKRKSATGTCGGSSATPSSEELPRGSSSPRTNPAASGRSSPKAAAHSSGQGHPGITASAAVTQTAADSAGGHQSPRPCSSSSSASACVPLHGGHSPPKNPRDSPRPSSSRELMGSTKNAASSSPACVFMNNASQGNDFPPEMFGLEDYDDSVLARVLAESQEDYFRQLKKQQQQQQAAAFQQSSVGDGSTSRSESQPVTSNLQAGSAQPNEGASTSQTGASPGAGYRS